MSVVEPLLVDLDALHAHLQALAHEGLGGAAAGAAVHGIDDEVPVHHLVAVEEVAVEDKAEGGVLFMLWVGGFEGESCRQRLEPGEGGVSVGCSAVRGWGGSLPAICLAFEIEDCVFYVRV